MTDPVNLVRRWTDALGTSPDEAVAAAFAFLADDVVAGLPTGHFTGADNAATALSTGPLVAVLSGAEWSEPAVDGDDVIVVASTPPSAPIEGAHVRFSFGPDDRAIKVGWKVLLHRHRNPITLPDGTVVIAVSFLEDEPYEREAAPAFGLYLDSRWQPPWTHGHLAWPDMGLPTDTERLVAALAPFLEKARRGDAVEIGCLGGHGRTGTALAVLAALAGLDEDPVAWVRENYCPSAIETPAQESFAREVQAARDREGSGGQ